MTYSMTAIRALNSAEANAAEPNDPLSYNARDFKDPMSAHLLARVEPFYRSQQARTAQGYWPYSRVLESAPQSTATLRDARGLLQQGVNFASQDSMALS